MAEPSPSPRKPVMLTIAGHDPSGGAGQQADIEAAVSHGCHASCAITAITVQDTHDVHDLHVLDPDLVVRQAEAVLADLPVAAIKLGVLGSAEVANAVADLLDRHAGIPVVLDPVLVAAGGGRLAEDAVVDVLQRRLLPRAALTTPNVHEARRLGGAGDDLDGCGTALLGMGCRYVLVTGGDEPGAEIENRLYGEGRLLQIERWPRLAGRFHGSGCTLASAAAALIARGHAPRDAAQQAQHYVHEALSAGICPGGGQMVPDRFYWARESQP